MFSLTPTLPFEDIVIFYQAFEGRGGSSQPLRRIIRKNGRFVELC